MMPNRKFSARGSAALAALLAATLLACNFSLPPAATPGAGVTGRSPAPATSTPESAGPSVRVTGRSPTLTTSTLEGAAPGASATSRPPATSTPEGAALGAEATSRPATPTTIHTCALILSPPTNLQSSGDPYYPSLGDAGYDTRHYTLDLKVDPLADTLQGSAQIEAAASQDLTSFSLDLRGFTIQSVLVNGTSAAYERKVDKLLISPASPLKEGRSFTVSVAYQGTPAEFQSLAMDMKVGWLTSKTQISAFGEPDGAQAWYPVNNHPCDKATYSLRVTVPKPYQAASNGLLVDAQEQGDTTTFHWENRSPTASYLVTLVIGDFSVETQTGPEGLPIRNYFPRGLADQYRPVFSDTPAMIAYYESVFGPYPFEAYGVAVVNTDLQDSALETQTLSIFDQGMLGDREYASLAAAHELAHQWYGDSVTLDNWQDIWLNEGFASYAEVLWLEHSQGPASARSYLNNMYRALSIPGRATPPAPGKPPTRDLFNISVYYRGALALHALRQYVGDEDFFAILKVYSSRFRYGNASTADFQALAEEISGKDLYYLIQAWVYDPTMPPMP